MPIGDTWLETNLLDDAIENLEMLHFVLESDYDARAKWKWIVIATFQALYGFAILSIRGTNDASIFHPEKLEFEKDKCDTCGRYYRKSIPRKFKQLRTQYEDSGRELNEEELRSDLIDLGKRICEELGEARDNAQQCASQIAELSSAQTSEVFDWIEERLSLLAATGYGSNAKLIGIYDALKRAKTDEYMPLSNSRPLVTTPKQDKAIDRLIKEFRNNFVHRSAMGWSIEVAAMQETVQTVLPVIRFLAFESNSILYDPEQRERTTNALTLLDERFEAMSRSIEPTENKTERRLAEKPALYPARQEQITIEEAVVSGPTKEEVTQILRNANLLVESSIHADLPPLLSEERREELARQFSVGKPLSEVIIEERER